jgi:coproporphyrinogen III oxidase-like Fe-S oxidoreductase
MSIPAKRLWKPFLQKVVTGHWRPFRMSREIPPFPQNLQRTGLYLHIPFCKNLCPYCPYNRVQYEERAFARFEEGVCQEIEMYAPYLQGMEFVSLYIGGGTPTIDPDGLIRIIRHLQERLALDCDICIELHPASMDDQCLAALREIQVSMVSIGVESTSDRLLTGIGRSHDGKMAMDAVRRVVRAGFQAVNVDLMFALPGQTLRDWEHDLEQLFAEDIDQLSTYPMFAFPYSELGAERGIKEVTRPSSRQIRAMLKMTDEFARKNGFQRCSVWSWLKPRKKKFSSISRHHYIGFGPSAASMTGSHFYVNTFDVDAYADSLPQRRPVALSMKVDRRLEMAYWLYWRVYELIVSGKEFDALFSGGASLRQVFGKLLGSFRLLGMLKKTGPDYRVTTAGAYWIHRLQNEYSLSYIDRLWGTCRQEPWPGKVRL